MKSILAQSDAWRCAVTYLPQRPFQVISFLVYIAWITPLLLSLFLSFKFDSVYYTQSAQLLQSMSTQIINIVNNTSGLGRRPLCGVFTTVPLWSDELPSSCSVSDLHNKDDEMMTCNLVYNRHYYIKLQDAQDRSLMQDTEDSCCTERGLACCPPQLWGVWLRSSVF